jgi:ABC-type uncharacterized transport system involved in gliding motility auxiliary subunit
MIRFLKSRMFRYGSSAIASVLVVLSIMVVINYLANRYNYRVDTTEGKIYSLSDQTTTILGALPTDVHVVAFFSSDERKTFGKMLSDYAHHSDRFSYRFVDPDSEPAETRRYKVSEHGTTIVEAGGKSERFRGVEEKDLTNAIAKVLTGRKKTVYFLTGHGESPMTDMAREGYSKAKQALLSQNVGVRDTLLLSEARSVPEDCDLLIVAGPRKRFFETELDSIRSYLESGGSLFLLIDPEVESGLGPMLQAWSIKINDDFVVDESGIGTRLFGLDYSMPIAAEYATHPVTAKHKGLMTFYRYARSITKLKPSSSMDVHEIVKTSFSSWRETTFSEEKPKFEQGQDIRGPASLAVAVQALPRKPSRRADGGRSKTLICVFGDSDFATNQYFDSQGNGDLFLNAATWLLQEEDLISIRPKQRGESRIHLTRADARWVMWLSVVVLPALPIVAGILVWRRRR